MAPRKYLNRNLPGMRAQRTRLDRAAGTGRRCHPDSASAYRRTASLVAIP